MKDAPRERVPGRTSLPGEARQGERIAAPCRTPRRSREETRPVNDLAPGHADPRTSRDDAGGALEEIALLGQPSLQQHLDFVRDTVVGGENANLRAVCDEWRRANDVYHELEESEAGIADEAECLELDPALEPLAEEVRADPRFRRGFDALPTTFGMVELDRLVVYQTQVTRQFVEATRARLGERPDKRSLFRLCLPVGQREAAVEIRRTGTRRYTFSSPSTDLRFHEATLLRAAQIGGYDSFGPIGGAVGLVVGFGSNMLNVVRSDTRMVLHNGYHRACAMRAAGVTHAPCVIQTVTRRAELAVAAAEKVCENAAFYFKAARPPLLKDFFDPRLSKAFPVRRTRKVVEASFETRVYAVAD